jgi:cysteine-S-conjugate beta-lyase
VIPLWLADMDFRSPRAIIEALKHRCDHGVFGYTHPSMELVDTVLARLDAAYGWTVERDGIVWLPGLVTGLHVSCRTVGEDGDEVLSAVPSSPGFPSSCDPDLSGLLPPFSVGADSLIC